MPGIQAWRGQVIYLDMVLHVAEPRCPSLRGCELNFSGPGGTPTAPLQQGCRYFKSVRTHGEHFSHKMTTKRCKIVTKRHKIATKSCKMTTRTPKMATKRRKMTRKRHKITTEMQNDYKKNQNTHKETQNDHREAK